MKHSLQFLSVVISLALPAAALAQQLTPRITGLAPRSGRPGETVSVHVFGERMNGVGACLVDGKDITAKVTSGPGDKPECKLDFQIAKDAKPGIREFRLIAHNGPSSVGYFLVDDLPLFKDPDQKNKKERRDMASALPITPPCAVEGQFRAEVTDHYQFTATAGQTLGFEVVSKRLHANAFSRPSDPQLELVDARGGRLAFNDDFFQLDPLIIHTFAADGTYYLRVRDVDYMGGGAYQYLLHVSDRPMITSAVPQGGQRGTKVKVRLNGANLDDQAEREIEIPADAEPGAKMDLRVTTKRGASNIVPFLVGKWPEVVEQPEPHDAPEKAQKLTAPCTVNGAIGKPGEADFYAVKLKAGQRVLAETHARRYGSPADTYLVRYDDKGQEADANDDAGNIGKDSRLDFTAGNDGEYLFAVKDISGNGAPHHTYRLTFAPSEPDFALSIQPDNPCVGPGDRVIVTARLQKFGGFDSEVQLAADHLPPGVTLSDTAIPPGRDSVVMVLAAAADAKPAGIPFVLRGTARLKQDGKDVTLTRIATGLELRKPMNRFSTIPTRLCALAVTAKSDVILQVQPAEVTLAPGVTNTVKIINLATNGFGGYLPIEVRNQTGGVRAKGTFLNAKKREDEIQLWMDAGAAPTTVKLLVTGNVAINDNYYMVHAAPPLTVRIPEPAKKIATK